MLHEAISPLTAVRPLALGGPVGGGETWLMPSAPGPYPWVSAAAPQIHVIDRRPARPAGRA